MWCMWFNTEKDDIDEYEEMERDEAHDEEEYELNHFTLNLNGVSNRTKSKKLSDARIEKQFKKYENGIKSMALIFSILSFVSCLTLVYQTDLASLGTSNILAPYHIITGLLAASTVVSEFNRNTRLMATRAVTAACAIFFIGVYFALQLELIAVKCRDEFIIASDPVINRICSAEYEIVITSIIFVGVLLLTVIVQIVLDILARNYILKHPSYFRKYKPKNEKKGRQSTIL
jgi:hypothetical protein